MNVWEATQTLAYQFQPEFPHGTMRHRTQRHDGGSHTLMKFIDASGLEEEEKIGSYHFVQGWKQQ